MNVDQICSRKVVTIHRDDGILEAARRMREEHVGDLVVVEEQADRIVPVGILTDRDIVVGVLAKDGQHLDVLDVGDVVTADLVTASEDEDLDTVLRRMRSFGVRRVPIVNSGGGLEGVLSLDDIIDALSEDMAELAALVSRQRRREAARRP